MVIASKVDGDGPQSVVDVVMAFSESPFNFYKTGSRAFFNANQKSDHDFFAANTEGVKSFLKKLGFLVERNHDYYKGFSESFQDIALVMRHPLGIDVQLVEDVSTKQDIQAAMQETRLVHKLQERVKHRLTKTEAIVMWETAHWAHKFLQKK